MRTRVDLAKNYSVRIKRHRLNAEWLGDKFGRQAEKEDDWLFHVEFGRDPEFAAPSQVECCLIVSNHLGLSVVILSTCGPRVSSWTTAANRCVPGAGAIWENCPKKAREAADKLRKLHEDYWNEMETLAAMASD